MGTTPLDTSARPWQRGDSLPIRERSNERELAAGTEASRPGRAIVAAGRRLPIDAPVVLWSEPGGMNAYARAGTRASFAPGREDPASPGARVASPAGLARVIDQLVLHYDACGTSRRCFAVLEERGLSVHFLLDVDGTLYQTLDLAETAWHARQANPRSIGIEIAQIGAYPPGDGTLERWYRRDAGGVRVVLPEGDGNGIRTRGFVPRPARAQKLRGPIHGTLYEQYDFTPEQYETLAQLATVLVRSFPQIELAVPVDSAGRVRAQALGAEEFADFGGILGHYHVTRDKTDPGPAFDWKRFLARTEHLLREPAP